jgi:N-methylhydantoinase A
VRERSLFDGTASVAMTSSEIARAFRIAKKSGAQAIAICLLHSYANPRAEDALAHGLEKLGLPLSVSHRLLAEYREYERFSTAVVNAYVAPKMSSHLRNLERNLAHSRLRIMQSNGSATGVELARTEPIRTILSGPAAGVVGAAALARAIGSDKFITFDMGGTSTDVSLFDRAARIRTLSYPDGYAVRAPVIDIHTVGAGGGSIARVDAGGSLRVGPESAGADPGPACYGRGIAPAVTDADLVAGRLVAENFLGGRMLLYPDRATKALRPIATALKSSAIAAARGVIRVVNANMERAIRVISVERGFDPRDFALLAFGGAGPMHAAELALDLGIRHVVFPRNPGLLCAWGAVGAPLGREYSVTLRLANPACAALAARTRPLIARAKRELLAEGGKASAFEAQVRLDMRYLGQSYELEVPLDANFKSAFHAAHHRTFGHSAPEASVEVVNLRLRASAADSPPPIAKIPRQRGTAAPIAHCDVLVGSRERRTPVYARDSLGAGARIRGPAIVVELSATAYVAPEFTMRVDDYGNLHLEAGR